MELEVGRLKLQQQKSDKLINELKYNFQEEKRKRKKERKRKVRGHTYLRHHCEGVNGSLDYVNGSYDCVNESCDHISGSCDCIKRFCDEIALMNEATFNL